jgi:hypothetical protein
VVDQPDTRHLIAPEALIPPSVTESEARDSLAEWREHDDRDPALISISGLYVPAWMFEFAGDVQWTGMPIDAGAFARRAPAPVSGSHPVMGTHALVCASDGLPEALRDSVQGFDLSRLVPYDVHYLADWPAETYRIPLETATIEARGIAVSNVREEVQEALEGVHNLQMSFARVAVDAFKLLLLPFWVCRIGPPGARRTALVNATNRAVSGEAGPRGVWAWLGRFW